jgi:hypothetical protein
MEEGGEGGGEERRSRDWREEEREFLFLLSASPSTRQHVGAR